MIKEHISNLRQLIIPSGEDRRLQANGFRRRESVPLHPSSALRQALYGTLLVKGVYTAYIHETLDVYHTMHHRGATVTLSGHAMLGSAVQGADMQTRGSEGRNP